MPGIRNFKDKVVVITGAGSGIGRATALAFAREGADLVIADVKPERLAEVQAEIEALGGRALSYTLDVSQREQVQALAEFVIAEKGRVDIVHNNAGVAVSARFEDLTLADWEWVLSIDLWGVIFGIHYFLPHLIKQRSGHIVNTASIAGLGSIPGLAPYNAAKFGVVGISETLRGEVRRHNIGVSVICPGVIDTRVVVDGKMNLRPEALANRDQLADFYQKRGWPAESVARAVLRAVRWNLSVVPVGPEAWASWFFKRVSQTGFDAMVRLTGDRLL